MCNKYLIKFHCHISEIIIKEPSNDHAIVSNDSNFDAKELEEILDRSLRNKPDFKMTCYHHVLKAKLSHIQICKELDHNKKLLFKLRKLCNTEKIIVDYLEYLLVSNRKKFVNNIATPKEVYFHIRNRKNFIFKCYKIEHLLTLNLKAIKNS